MVEVIGEVRDLVMGEPRDLEVMGEPRDLEVMGEVKDLEVETDKLIWRSNKGVAPHQGSNKETVLREAKIEMDHHRIRAEMDHHRIREEMDHHRIRVEMDHQGIKIETDLKEVLN